MGYTVSEQESVIAQNYVECAQLRVEYAHFHVERAQLRVDFAQTPSMVYIV